MANRPLTPPQIDYSGGIQANQITARAGEIYAQQLQEGLSRIGASIGGALQQTKQRKHQSAMQAKSLEQDELQSLRSHNLQVAHLNAETTRAVMGTHQKSLEAVNEQIDQYRQLQLPVPPELLAKQKEADQGIAKAMTSLTMVTGGRAAELGLKPKAPT